MKHLGVASDYHSNGNRQTDRLATPLISLFYSYYNINYNMILVT